MLTEAIRFAADAHGAARRKDGSPAVLHAMEAATIAATMSADAEVLAAAALHDVVEDAGVPMAEIRARFGERVAHLVAADTEDKRRELPPEATWRVRKEETIAGVRAAEDAGARIVCLSDKLSNMRAFYRGTRRAGDAFWNAFHQRDPEQHHWYYRELAAALSPLADTPAWMEYDWLIRQVFHET